MRDEVANRLRPGQVVQVTAVVCEYYDGRGALLLEIREKNCAQQFWFPVGSVVELEVPDLVAA